MLSLDRGTFVMTGKNQKNGAGWDGDGGGDGGLIAHAQRLDICVYFETVLYTVVGDEGVGNLRGYCWLQIAA